MKTAVIYHYYELNQCYKDNLIFFLSTAVYDELEYFLYISGNCSVELPNLKNFQITIIENKNNDFGGVIEFYKNNKYLKFDNYIFINSSVRGPFLPNYHSSKWYEVFTKKLNGSVAMVGSSINLLPLNSFHSRHFKEAFNYAPPYIHVQTTAYALSFEGFDLLTKKDFFNITENLSKNDVISYYEILLSQLLLNHGLKISSILPTYEEFSFSKRDTKHVGTSLNGDILYRSAFYGRTLSPFESIFTKTNRKLISKKELASFTYTSLVSLEAQDLLTKDGLSLFQRSLNKIHFQEKIFIRMLGKIINKLEKYKY